MNEFIHYLIDVNTGLILLLAAYYVILRNENQFSVKRYFLVGSTFLSLVFPLIKNITRIGELLPSPRIIPVYWLPEIQTNGKIENSFAFFENVSVMSVTEVVYFTVASLLSLIFAVRILSILLLIKRSESYSWNGCSISESKSDKPVFSFFRFIFIGHAAELSSAEKQTILNHELVHAKKGHSFDILLLQAVGILCWFNPALYIYKSELRKVHEYEADSVAAGHEDIDSYCRLMAKVALHGSGYYLASHFHQTLTLKRIIMMKTMKKKIQSWKVIALVAVLPTVLFIISCNDQHAASNNSVAEKDQASKATANTDSVYNFVEQQPVFPGGMEGLISYLQKNINYPKTSAQGKVMVKFIVEKDGKITGATALKGINPACDKEAVRVISAMPAWSPAIQKGEHVRCSFVIPINFKLS